MWASAWHLASWCLDWAFHLLHGGRQVENLIETLRVETLSSVLNSLSKAGFFHGWFIPVVVSCIRMWRRILYCFVSSAALKFLSTCSVS